MGDATPFNGRTVEDIAAELEAHGFQRYGDEVMYNPRSGEQVPCAIFICPTYYQRLKHMVEDKVHSRGANGPVVLLTRQPAEGRARDGGLRLGEMELECLWAHGSMYFLKERFMECSDNYRVFVCNKCGMMATVNPERGIYFCKACKNITDFAEFRIPYASKLLLQEIETMSIGARFDVSGAAGGGRRGGGRPQKLLQHQPRLLLGAPPSSLQQPQPAVAAGGSGRRRRAAPVSAAAMAPPPSVTIVEE